MKTELYAAVAVLLYIVFLSHSPPRVLRDLLSNEYIAFVVFALCAYVTLWRSRTIGVLLILAFILTMTRVTEHLDVPPPTPDKPTETPPTPPTNTPPPPPPPVPSTSPTIDSSTAPGMAASTPTTPVTASATSAPSPAQPPPPIAAPPPPPTAPATPPVPTAPPAPVMSCNIESFASF